MPPDPLGILLISGGHERAHYAFMLAAGAAAMGRRVLLFATNEGCRALGQDVSSWAGDDRRVQACGVAGLDTLRDACVDLGVELMACDSGLLMAGMGRSALLPGVEVVGIPTFLAKVGAGMLTSL